MIRKTKHGYAIYSKTKHRHLGTYTTKAKAIKREKQINYFKHLKRK